MFDQKLKTGARIYVPDQHSIENELENATQKWIDTINGGQAECVDALYKPDAVLLATFDPNPRTTSDTRIDYFLTFKTRRKLYARIDSCKATAIGKEGGVSSGFYTFSFVDTKGTPHTVQARFTFVFERQTDGEWLIVAHHSSQAPLANAAGN